jgi:hypothetical protein
MLRELMQRHRAVLETAQKDYFRRIEVELERPPGELVRCHCLPVRFVALRGTLDSLRTAQGAYYAQQRFGDVFVSLRRAPEPLRARIEALPGVALAYTRLSELVRLPLTDLPEPAIGRVIFHPAQLQRSKTSSPVLGSRGETQLMSA